MKTREQLHAERAQKGLPHWKPSQRKRLQECIDQGATIVYWNSDTWGRPANGGSGGSVYAGLVQEIPGIRPVLCGPGAFHATKEPHRWAGTRVWVVAMWGVVVWDGDKCGSLKREILGEILPSEAWVSASVSARLGVKANLTYANLTDANLTRADLTYANLTRANLTRADLTYANLTRADLTGAYRGHQLPAPAGWHTLASGYLERDQ